MILKATTQILPQDLDITDSPTFAGLTLSGLTEGSILFAGVGGILSQDNTNLFWDNSSNFLRVNELRLDNNAYIKIGANQDVKLGYDSANAQALLDLTGVVNTGYHITASNDANIFNIFDDPVKGRSSIQIGNGKYSGIAKLSISTTTASANEQNQALDVNITGTGTSNPSSGTFNADAQGDNQATGVNFGARVRDTNLTAVHPYAGLTGLSGEIKLTVDDANTYTVANARAATAFFVDRGSWNGGGTLIITNMEGFSSRGFVGSNTIGAGDTISIGDLAHFKVYESIPSTGTVTIVNNYGLKVEALNQATNNYGIYISEITGGTIRNEMFLAGGGEVFFRQQDIHIGSLSENHLDLTAPFINLNGIVEIISDTDVVIYDSVSELARFNAGTHNLEFKDNKNISLGTNADVLLGYDSVNAQALFDLTGVANTDFKLKATGGYLFMDGATGDLLLSSDNKFQFGDSNTYINQALDGILGLYGDGAVSIISPLVGLNTQATDFIMIDNNAIALRFIDTLYNPYIAFNTTDGAEQVEIYKDLVFMGEGSGLPFGHAYMFEGSTTVSVGSADTWYELTSGLVTGEVNNVTFGGAHYLSVDKAGRFEIDWAVSLNTVSAGQEIMVSITVNGADHGVALNSESTNAKSAAQHGTVSGVSKDTQLSGYTILDLAVNDQVSIIVMNKSGATDILIEHVALKIKQDGGT